MRGLNSNSNLVLTTILYFKSSYNAFESVLSIDIISCVTCTIIIKIKTNDDVAQLTTAKHIQTFLIIIYIISVKL